MDLSSYRLRWENTYGRAGGIVTLAAGGTAIQVLDCNWGDPRVFSVLVQVPALAVGLTTIIVDCGTNPAPIAFPAATTGIATLITGLIGDHAKVWVDPQGGPGGITRAALGFETPPVYPPLWAPK